ncbi:MAG TPA: SRPBCC domain-containing protein [Vicinamibacterales bacterium]|nr:SRPBCC domain-containing protein [Vicinamibacterales bacterium]
MITPPTDRVEHSVLVSAAPTRVLEAFFDAAALQIWWQTSRSVTTPRPLGVYALEWEPTTEVDDVLGRLGGVFYGLVVDFRPGRELFLADAWWLPPDGDPLGPMSLEVRCSMDGPACRLRVTQSGFGEGPRWDRYREVIGRGWRASLMALKAHAEV